MADISRYVYQSLVTKSGTEPFLYKNDKNIIYSAFAMSADGEEWLDLFYSDNDGDTWQLDNDLPIKEDTVLHNPRIFQRGDILYLLASGKNASSGKECTYIIRKFFNVDDGMGNLSDIWEEEWTEIIYDTRYHCRLTDVTADEDGFYMYLTYDKATKYSSYEVRLCIFSLSDFEVKIDVSASGTSTINHHGAKMVLINDGLIGMTWQRQNVSIYDNKNYQIYYREYDVYEKEFHQALLVSNDDKYNNYHPSIVKDSADNVYISWLHTQDTNVDGSVKYYVESSIYIATIQQNDLADIEIISSNANKNEYPYLVNDEYDNLYVMYNGREYVNYLTRKVGRHSWTEISNVKKTEWKVLNGFCYNNNLYCITQKEDFCYMLRIDTLLAENFAPVSDFQIVDVNATEIKFAWTAARNAEDIKLQGVDYDYEKWEWKKPNTTSPITTSTNTAYCVGLDADTVYAFKLVYKTTDKQTHTKFFPRRYISQQDHDENYTFTWKIPDNITEQTLYVAKEVWVDLADIANASYTYTHEYGSEATSFRLKITGGMADGYSNTVSPLLIDIDDNGNYVLSWSAYKKADYIEMQQSIDGIHFYPVKNVNINPQAESYVVDKVNAVTYRYRLVYGNTETGYYFTNVATLTNNLKPLNISYNLIDLQWNDVEENEKIRFQYSEDEGNHWVTKSYPIKNSMATIKGLECNKNYWVRMYYPDRFTGKFSNIVKFKTEKHPVENFVIKEVKNTDVKLEFVTTNACANFDVLFEDQVSGTKTKVNMLDVNCSYLSNPYTAIKDFYSVDVLGLKKGTPYFVQIACRDCDWEYSNVDAFQTAGDAPQGLVCTATDKHTATLKWNALERITNANIKGRVRVQYSIDKNVWEEAEVDSVTQPFVLKGLMQNTNYYIRLVCDYGNNAGVSKIINAKTKTDVFEPVFGHRNHNELCFCVKGNLAYIFDKGILYKYNLTTNAQEIVYNYGIKANHIYSDIEMDKNGRVHLVFAYGKGIYYATNCKTKTGDRQLKDVITIEENEVVNEYLYPNMEINKRSNVVYIVWQENYGFYSNIAMAQYRNAEALTEESVTVFNTGYYNNAPLVKLDGQGGFVIATIDNAYRLNMMFTKADNDYNSATYQEYSFEMKTMELENPYTSDAINYDFWIDNMGQIRIFYDSQDENGEKTSTYATYNDEDEFKTQSIFNEHMNDTSVFALKDFIVIARNNKQIFTSKYLQDKELFSDTKLENVLVTYEIPLTVYCTIDKIYLLGFDQGMFLIQTLNVADIIQNEYVAESWISNQFIIANDDLEVNAEIWTSGNPKNYPQLFLKVNNRIVELTPLDEFGDRELKEIKVSKFEEVTEPNELMKVKITYNTNKTIVRELTDMLCYVWDENKEIVNKDEN